MKVLLIDDEASIRLLVNAVMHNAGHEALCLASGSSVIEVLKAERPDVVILDVMMPGIDGFEVCRRIRSVNKTVPIMFLTAKGAVADKRVGFELGGDDYLTKPFDSEELLIRVEALYRRRNLAEAPSNLSFLEIGPFRFDRSRHSVSKSGQELVLPPKEYDILLYLAEHSPAVVSKEELIENVWGEEYLGSDINLAVYVRRLRQKIEDNPASPKILKTTWAVGYTFSIE